MNGWVDPMLPPSPRRGTPGPLWLPPSDLPSVRSLRSSLPCQKLFRGDSGWVEHLGRLPARWRCHRARAIKSASL
eukprot:2817212-Pleurochrysis_carterae.AAC.1